MREALAQRIAAVLICCQPFPGDGAPVDPSYVEGEQRFTVDCLNNEFFSVYDRVQGFEGHIHISQVRWKSFSIGKWFSERCAVNSGICYPWDCTHQWLISRRWENTIMGHTLEDRTENLLHEWAPYYQEPNMADTTLDRF